MNVICMYGWKRTSWKIQLVAKWVGLTWYKYIAENGLGSQKEASDLPEAVKQTLYEEDLQAYSESNR
jgi:hypothetical protein